jgi:hypothetical protein
MDLSVNEPLELKKTIEQTTNIRDINTLLYSYIPQHNHIMNRTSDISDDELDSLRFCTTTASPNASCIVTYNSRTNIVKFHTVL